jgi:threonylcarbamoyladenosine tRNA methylthiotransferase MtaB
LLYLSSEPQYGGKGIDQIMNVNKKKVAFHTLGCKLNFAETSTISRSFTEDRFEKVHASKKADIYIINTCSVTDVADKKCRQAIKKFIHQSPDALIIVVGCYAQLNPQAISAIPGVDLVLGINEKFDITRYLDNVEKRKKGEIHSCELSSSDKFNASFSFGDRTRSFLKVQDGCDYKCAYCTIPMARGASKNPDIITLINEAETLAGKGIKEIVLTGVNIGDFGKSTGESFYDLLLRLVNVDGICRYRISSIEPNLLTDDLLKLASINRKILPHFHIPLQSGSNRMLGMMRRRYNREVFSDRIKVIKEYIPNAGIGADVIVGFPGESEEDFNDTYNFLDTLPLSYLHVFPFSERPGTVASTLPGKVSYKEKESRSKKLITLSKQKHHIFLTQNIGSDASVLFEHVKNAGMISGYTGNYIRVEHPWQPSLAGEVKNVKLNGIVHTDRMNIELKN